MRKPRLAICKYTRGVLSFVFSVVDKSIRAVQPRPHGIIGRVITRLAKAFRKMLSIRMTGRCCHGLTMIWPCIADPWKLQKYVTVPTFAKVY
jgi:hypothetical protein